VVNLLQQINKVTYILQVTNCASSQAGKPWLYLLNQKLFIYFYLFSSSTSNGIEVQTKNILAEWPTQG